MDSRLHTPYSDGLVDTSDDDSLSKAALGNEDSAEFNDTSDDDDAAQNSGKLEFVHLV